MSTTRIGFVDNQLDNYHANVYLKAIRGELAARGFAVAGCCALQRDSGREWAAKNDVPYFDNIRKLGRAVDAIMILAPSDPQLHLPLCRKVFPLRKPTYVDKTFATDSRTARKIFALADRHGVAVQTTSALRYTAVQSWVREVGAGRVRHMVAWGGGRSFGEYAIHPLELVVSAMGPQVERMMCRGEGDQRQLLLDFTCGRTAVINVYAGTNTAFAAAVTTDKETRQIAVDGARLFVDTAAAILDFFTAGVATIDRAESLVIRRLLDLAERRAARGRFVRV